MTKTYIYIYVHWFKRPAVAVALLLLGAAQFRNQTENSFNPRVNFLFLFRGGFYFYEQSCAGDEVILIPIFKKLGNTPWQGRRNPRCVDLTVKHWIWG